MGETCRKARIAEIAIMWEASKRGYDIAVPVGGHDTRYDLIVDRNGKLEKVQCKYTESRHGVVRAYCRSSSAGGRHSYTPDDIDWLAVYDARTGTCYFVPSKLFAKHALSLRLAPPKNCQKKRVLWARDFENW